MKKIILYCIALSIMFLGLEAKDVHFSKKISFRKFEKWMKSVKYAGYKLNEVSQSGSINYDDLIYFTDFQNASKDDGFSIQLNTLDYFYQFREMYGFVVKGPYVFKGMTVVYLNDIKGMVGCLFFVKLPEINATIIISSYLKSKEQMQGFVQALKPERYTGKIDPFKWPDEIKEKDRFSNRNILKIEKTKPLMGFGEYEYHLYVRKKSASVKDIEKFIKPFGQRIDSLDLGEFILRCPSAKTLKELIIKPDRSVFEMIYIKKKK